ncbi:PIN domain-containing protein [Thiothrix lacustris]|uniref:PIN domain-containing protein n=1 Tax=Thiothrix lacustris TaxID=525917 RepID=UPI000490B4AC|nr:PIN domain-containing protein [Thiothrix lacustris]
MSARPFFLDTNILIYANTTQDEAKKVVAQRLVTSGEAMSSAQTLNEFCNVLRRKFPDKFGEVEAVLQDIQADVDIVPLTAEMTRQAVALSKRYLLSFYDSLILAAASEYGCSAVLSEDLQHGFKLETGLVVINPFLEA